MFPVADKFCVYFALESLFLAFLKFTLENTIIQNSWKLSDKTLD